MDNFDIYNKIRLEIESRFAGLPHSHGTLVKSLLSKSDFNTGIVANISYRELSALLAVDHVPGRKNAGIPQKETIRSYLRTIALRFPDEFVILSQGQKLICQFLNLPKICEHFFNQNVSYTLESSKQTVAKPLENIDQNQGVIDLICDNAATELPIDAEISKLTAYININNNNNNARVKQPINQNFKPSPAIITKALSLGYTQAENPSEIEAFVAYNQAAGSRWADFNPIYLLWLAKSHEKQLKKSLQEHSGRAVNVRNKYQTTTQPTPRERVLAAYASEFALRGVNDSYSPHSTPRSAYDSRSMVATY